MPQQKMHKNYLTFKIFTFLIWVSLYAMNDLDDLPQLGFVSKAEQLSLIVQKNNETIFENIEYHVSLVFPTPPTAFLISLPFMFLGALLSTAIGFGPDSVSENGLFKNWGLITKNLIILYSTNPLFVCRDFPDLLYSFMRINQNKQQYEYQYNKKIKSTSNNRCNINVEILKHTSCSNTKEKIKNFFFREGTYLRGHGIWIPAIGHITKKITFNNNQENENIEDEPPEKNRENVLKKTLTINKKTRFAKITLSLNETTQMGYYRKDKFHRKKFFILDSSTNNTYPFLPNQALIDVEMTPDQTILIAITPIKTIKIDLTKNFNLTKQQLEKELYLKNKKEKTISLMGKGSLILVFLCYSLWWLKYFCPGYISQDIKKAGLLLDTYTTPALLSLPLDGIKRIIAAIKNVKLKNIGVFLFGKSKI